jgi:hypothetical protein
VRVDSLAQLGVADLLHHEIASEPAGRLDDDRPHSVGFDPLEHGGEARARVDGIGTAHGRVVELANELVASAAGECLDRFTLATVAVLVRSDVGRRRAVPFSWLAFDPIGFLVLQICRIPSPGFAARRFLKTRAGRMLPRLPLRSLVHCLRSS